MPHSHAQPTRIAFGSPDAPETALAEALRTLRADTSLHAEWIVGLATNRNAPHEVVRRVFTVDPLPEARYWLVYSRLTPMTAEVAVAHPEPRIRVMAAENPYLPPEWRAVLAEDPDPKVRRVAVMLAREYGVELPVELTVRLATGPEPRLRYLAAGLRGLPDAALLSLAEDDDPRVRAAAIGSWSWSRLRPEVRAAAAADPDPRVHEAVRHATHVDAPLPTTVQGFLAETEGRRRGAAASTAPVDAALAALLVTHEDSSIRHAAARNPHTPVDLALRLVADREPFVRLAVSLRPDVTEEQRARIAYTVPPGRHPVPDWVKDRFGDPDALRETAASSHVLLRRGVTCAPELPADVIERLAADEDYFVRLMLCENDHAPHELLVEMFAGWDGLSWGMLAHRSNFARPGLARFADDPNARLRYAALFDPQGGQDLVERLSHDEDALVGRRAASDPRLPRPRLVELLGEQGVARAAARNPSLPVALMHRLLDAVGVDR
ncbi:HEAT repeat domain-containing protein [Streptomyces sp. NPDC004735]|uniref:HEAT repeat domain-containing protein n=1 Tax=Streptomyces sp. NPDC004735 TaxID=3156654 RepID=UPI0033A40053